MEQSNVEPLVRTFECTVCRARLTPRNGPLPSGVYSGTCGVCRAPFKFWSVENPVKKVSFSLNGVKYTVMNPDALMSLNEWIRSQPHLTGTKVMCREGGCGCCTVVVTKADPVTNKPMTMPVNSCLWPLCNADGVSITTTEGIGNKDDGFHAIQERLADHNGSQCGYCSPGMVMNMYGLLKTNAFPSKQEIENHFDGNICRCTGYRPILDAMKTFAKDADPLDIEDVSRQCCTSCPRKSGLNTVMAMDNEPTPWYSPTTLKDLYTLAAMNKDKRIRFVGGNTGLGIYKDDGPYDIYICIDQIPELKMCKVSADSLAVGSAVTLSTLITTLDDHATSYPAYKPLAEHAKKVANVPVRNVATVGGNLMLTHDHPYFLSDLMTIFETIGARVVIGDAVHGSSDEYTLMSFLNMDMKSKILVGLMIPLPTPATTFVRTYKVMPRAQNAHAYVNAGFATTLDKASLTGSSFRLVYGGIGPYAIHATKTETYLEGKPLTQLDTLKGALAILSSELSPDPSPASSSPAYRKSLGLSLFYKFYLAMLGDKASARLRSAAVPYTRAISSGTQNYDSHPELYPLTKPMTKLSAKLQASGEAQYTNDIPAQNGELYAAFVLASQGNCKIASIDATIAKALPGVVEFMSASSIPQQGVNNFMPTPNDPEEIFCSGEVLFAGQAIGLILADSQRHADKAAEAVKIVYKDIATPILSIKAAIAAKSFFPAIAPMTVGDAEGAIKTASHVISGEIAMDTQHHFHMETQVCRCVPEEDGITVHSATQWIDLLQSAVAQALGFSVNKVHVDVKRCGGAYGGKASRSLHPATAVALAAHVFKRPVRMMMNFNTNMKMVGKRTPYLVKYKVGTDDSGTLKGIDMTMYADYGCSVNDSDMGSTYNFCDNAYYCANWKINAIPCRTNTASNTWCRAPGSIQAVFIMESIMEHVAKSLGKTPEDVRQVNLYQKNQTMPSGQALKYCNIRTLWQDLQETSEFLKRKAEVESFNKANRWRKRGLSLVPLRWSAMWGNGRYGALVSVFNNDGTVQITHGGIEVGQGINTKVVQVAAHTLGIPVDYISIQATTSFTTPNNNPTGGSIASEMACKAVLQCCEALNNRLTPIRQKYKPKNWQELISKSYSDGVDLSAKSMFFDPEMYPIQYSSYGATCTEAELDVLTGESQILRTDILYDCGQSMNPELDVGQVEGAFIMGLGLWLMEKVKYNPQTGQELTSSTWEYKPPSSKDIPIDLRVTLLKKATNPLGILGSKVVGEPPMCMAASCLFAVKHAIQSAREEIGKDSEYFPLDGPATVDAVQQACLVDPAQFSL
ncbi:xanthine dehydrogenase/oxidase-like [Nematostella vectensis]|uniref:xanthine dehydrogenase/oxidase-like n=1 Tax=Nematostella vectensis TaxID=45351 RepID=UPI0020776DCD|nr:xanthine dehydrogenase/oxidase-like [Nematostella vectensis]